ncbi:hypothetical protein [Olivibacter sitiensis]|uniref:hypothetical protein n=1 Tax=Olivibacter sitiensis TaxID=376470 RepID=UPI000421A9DB|nr:hypothetical protein [Olivibacter sitiensis]
MKTPKKTDPKAKKVSSSKKTGLGKSKLDSPKPKKGFDDDDDDFDFDDLDSFDNFDDDDFDDDDDY